MTSVILDVLVAGRRLRLADGEDTGPVDRRHQRCRRWPCQPIAFGEVRRTVTVTGSGKYNGRAGYTFETIATD